MKPLLGFEAVDVEVDLLPSTRGDDPSMKFGRGLSSTLPFSNRIRGRFGRESSQVHKRARPTQMARIPHPTSTPFLTYPSPAHSISLCLVEIVGMQAPYTQPKTSLHRSISTLSTCRQILIQIGLSGSRMKARHRRVFCRMMSTTELSDEVMSEGKWKWKLVRLKREGTRSLICMLRRGDVIY